VVDVVEGYDPARPDAPTVGGKDVVITG